MTETEIKSIIDEETYLKIQKAFKWDSIKEQENNYYTDREGVLRENRIMVRVRVVDGIYKLQVKLHKNNNSPLQICEENEYDIENIPETIDAETAKKITEIDVGELFLMGNAVTMRHSINHNGSELCLDKTTYFDKVDYEAEVEYEDKMSADLLMKLTSFGVAFNKKSVGKFSRFLAEYEKHQTEG